jgi:hypothetical protein
VSDLARFFDDYLGVPPEAKLPNNSQSNVASAVGLFASIFLLWKFMEAKRIFAAIPHACMELPV